MPSPYTKKIFAAVIGITALGMFASMAYANHSWDIFHWARTANPFTLKLGDNLSPIWDSYLAGASGDWSASSVLDIAVVPGARLRNCNPINGRVELCNKKYGRNGWLGVATIWANEDHIIQGTVKFNDTYFTTAQYNTPAWRNLVMCQEVGHMFGLDHQDVDFTNSPLGTCMDYTSDPVLNQHPNQHDYEELETIYAHHDSSATIGNKLWRTGANMEIADGGDKPENWGKLIKKSRDGRESLYERDLGKGQKMFTFVTWVD